MDTFLLRCTMRNVNANSVASRKRSVNYRRFGIPMESEGCESALQVGDQIVAVFESGGQPQQVGRDARFPPRLGWHAAVSHGRRGADQSRKSPQRRGQSYQIQRGDESVARVLPAAQLKTQHES